MITIGPTPLPPSGLTLTQSVPPGTGTIYVITDENGVVKWATSLNGPFKPL